LIRVQVKIRLSALAMRRSLGMIKTMRQKVQNGEWLILLIERC